MSNEYVERIDRETVEERAQRDRDYEEYKQAGRIWGLVPKERIRKIRFPRIDTRIVHEFLQFEDLTTTVSDILDSLGINGVIPSSYLKPLTPGQKTVGTAVTIRNIPERVTPTQGYVDKEIIKMSTREIYYMSEEGDVLVTDFDGNLDVSNMGGQSCTVAKSSKFAGSVVNGAVRDVSAIRNLNYPVWSCGTTPITGKYRMIAVEMNGPVTLLGVLVEAGDLIIADDSGVCVVPPDLVEYVLEQTKKIVASEERMRRLIESKAPLSELRPLFRNRYK